MIRIKTLDVLRDTRSPFRDDGCGAAMTARFIAELPGEDCGTLFVACHEGFDVCFVNGLGFWVGEPGGRVAAEGGGICVDAAIVAPVVDKGEDELEAVSFGGGEGVVEALEAGGTVINVTAC
jgi:hypothetical protein